MKLNYDPGNGTLICDRYNEELVAIEPSTAPPAMITTAQSCSMILQPNLSASPEAAIARLGRASPEKDSGERVMDQGVFPEQCSF